MTYNKNSVTFKVVPLCERQKRDIKKEHLLDSGLYRVCDVYKGGGGYDKFPEICKRRLGYSYNVQFVVQLYGCTLSCPYCYVTKDGIFGSYKEVSLKSLLMSFDRSNQNIFHLMGGAPALYIDDWNHILDKMDTSKVFHSDMLLTEKEYCDSTLDKINRDNTLYAVSIKGYGDSYKSNTGVEFNSKLFWSNLNKLVAHNINFYFTYTNMSDTDIKEFKEECKNSVKYYEDKIFEDDFKIELVRYESLK